MSLALAFSPIQFAVAYFSTFISTTTSNFSIADVIALVSSLVTALIGWMGSFIGFMVDHPIILIPFALGMVYMAVRLLRKMFGMLHA